LNYGVKYPTIFFRGTKNIVPQGHCFIIRPGEIHHRHPNAGYWNYFTLNIHKKVVRDVSSHQGTVPVSDAVTRDQKLVAAVVKIISSERESFVLSTLGSGKPWNCSTKLNDSVTSSY
jgi:AraC-like ligand binding domain